MASIVTYEVHVFTSSGVKHRVSRIRAKSSVLAVRNDMYRLGRSPNYYTFVAKVVS